MHSLLIDIGDCCEHHSNEALEHLHKAIGEGEPDDIWLPHPSVLLRRLVELFTQRGLIRIDGFIKELQAWQEGERHRAGNRPARPDGAMERWTPGELKLVKLYLETLPPDEFTLDDHMMVVDYIANRYLSPTDMRSEAEWLAVRSALMGRVQANMARAATLSEADKLLAAMPNTINEAEARFGMSTVQRAVMEFGRARAAENVTSMSWAERHRVKRIVMRHQEARALGDTSGPSLQSDLLDAMGEMNRDWRRIAVTEAGENQNQGYVASLQPGAKVRRLEQYRNACPWCRKIDGMVFEVVDASDPDKDGEKAIWVGKTNIGRSAAPRKRMGGQLIEREPHEMYWVAAGTQHPHCRGSWLPVIEDRPGDDPEFGDWLRATLAKPEAK
jgi:hypothetical protein